MVQVRVLGVALDAARQHIVLLKPLLEGALQRSTDAASAA
jgi:hypothetical protein